MATALELTSERWKPYLTSARGQRSERQATLAELADRKRVLACVRHAAVALKRRFGSAKVILFGSLAHSAWFAPDSDVDLAVEGLDGDEYWEAWKVVEDVITDRAVDLIDLAMASESLRAAIERHGIEL